MTISVKDASGATQTVRTLDDLDKGAGTGGSNTQRLLIDSSQMSALTTVDFAKASGAVPMMMPTDQLVPNKVQSQDSGGTKSRVNAAASTNATNLKASAGNILEIDVYNVAVYDVFLKLYNKASAPTVGTDTPVWTIPVKAGSGYSKVFPYGEQFSTGIAYAITKLQPDSDASNLAAGDLTGRIKWI